MAVLPILMLGKCTTSKNLSVSAEKNVSSTDGVEIIYNVYGSSAKTVVLIHGWSCNQTYWDEQVPYLKNDYQVVTIDLGGHGKSTLGNRSDWTISALKDDVLAVVNELSYDEISLVGHSMGTLIALEAVAELDHEKVRFIAVDYLKTELRSQPREVMEKQMAPFSADFEASAKGFASRLFNDTASEELKERVKNDMAGAHPEVAVNLIIDFASTDFTPLLKELHAKKIPSFIINSEIRPTDEDYYGGLGFQIHTMENSHHFMFMDREKEFNDLLGMILEK